MVNENDLLEPRKAYETTLKEEHKENARKYFDKLAGEVGVDVAANEATMKELASLQTQEADISKSLKKKKSQAAGLTTLGVICIVLAVIAVCVGGALVNNEDTNVIGLLVAIIGGILFLGLGIFILIMNAVKVKPVIRDQSSIISRLQSAEKEKMAIGYSQMKELNDSYTWNMHVDIVNETIPTFKLDRYFDNARLNYLKEYFGYQEINNKDISTVHVQSGQLLGNPFIIQTMKVMNMGTYTYSGSITITYTVRVPNGGKNGGYHTETRTQTLTAHVTKPKPYYNYEKVLYYGCDAAPELSFSRTPSGLKNLNEGDAKKLIAKLKKDLAKLSEKEMGKSFQALGNTEFEALFHAWDRNNEVQYRLLFTPLAQRNYLDLIKDNNPYGDDFSLVKSKKLNKVVTAHSQYTDYVCSPDQFKDYSYENAKKKFVEYNEKYFRSIWFDMAALISIPLYQQYPTDDYIFRNTVGLPNNTLYEDESIANSFNPDVFKPLKCSTEQILKAKHVKNEGEADRVNVTSHGFETKEHIEHVSMYGKDGRWHDVPVKWIEYLPVSKDSEIEVLHHQLSKRELNQKVQSTEFQQFVNNNVSNGQIVYNKEFYSFVVPAKERTYNNEQFNALRVEREGK